VADRNGSIVGPNAVEARQRPDRDAKKLRRMGIASWAADLEAPGPELPRSRNLAHLGGIVAIVAPVLYLAWRIAFTLPPAGWNLVAAWCLVVFEALPLIALVVKIVTVWNIDSRPAPAGAPEMRVVVLIPTYNEPVGVLAPTVAASVALQPAHETWVLDDGDRPWVAELCASYGARYVSRSEHHHAKAGNMNHALRVMEDEEAAGAVPVEVIAVLDCDHVPLTHFLSSTLGWFADPEIALVQGPQCFYNAGAFDDDGVTGEQGVFFNVLMPSRNLSNAGPFWCGSTSLLRVSALRDVGGVATETIAEDMHTTIKLLRRGWKTVYHHQTLAVGLAPATPEQYLVQRRRWGLGAMQILVSERLWAAKSWMSWRNFHEYLNGTLWWLEGVATVLALLVPVAILFSGAQTSTAGPVLFVVVFGVMFTLRLWGSKQLMRGQISWPTAFALRIFRIPVGLACLWWLVSRKPLAFEVTPKGAENARLRGRVPRIITSITLAVFLVIFYAVAGLLGWVPWHTDPASTIASGVWLLVAAGVLLFGILRIRAEEFATSRRDAHRITVAADVWVDGAPGRLQNISLGGAAIRLADSPLPSICTSVCLDLPGSSSVVMDVVNVDSGGPGIPIVSLSVREGDWGTYRALSLWIFHTPDGALPGWPAGVPAAASLGSDPIAATARQNLVR
jgi:cellulose synthase (UDP-forming)